MFEPWRLGKTLDIWAYETGFTEGEAAVLAHLGLMPPTAE